MSRRTARSPLAALTAVAVGVGLVGCGSTRPAPQWREGSTGPTAVTSGTATAPHAPREVRLAFAGNDAGVDAVSIADNHILDYGRQRFADTFDAAAEARYPVFGAGLDATRPTRPG
ncbi:CapA family protein [Micromonospora marina]|uniref:CapA family protein n=1 Tax=Micromonospora marina TaxID=307120 RepID=UPI0034524F56